MSFRRRVVLLAAAAVAAAIVIASAIVYVVTGGQLQQQVDGSLKRMLVPGPQSVKVRTQELDASQRANVEKAAQLLGPQGIPVHTLHLRSSERRTLEKVAAQLAPVRRRVGSAYSSSARASPGSAAGTSTGSVGSGAGGSTGSGTGGSARSSAAGSNLSAAAVSHAFGGNAVEVHEAQGVTATAPAPRFKYEPVGPIGFGETIIGGANGKVIAAKVSLPSETASGAGAYAQLVFPGNRVVKSNGPGSKMELPVTAATRSVAAGRRAAFYSNATIRHTPYRVLTAREAPGGVWQVALPLTGVDDTLKRLLIVLGIVSLGGVLIAAALGMLVSRAALAPVRRLTRATERIAETQDLAHRIPADDGDDLGRLALSFNTMLSALERSRLAQRQLISDASHELRTPLTSIQANLDALALGDGLSAGERARAVASSQAQLRELTAAMSDLIDLSKTEVEELEIEDVRLDLAVAAALRRTRLHAPEIAIELDAVPSVVRASPARLDRAIANLLDNAVKWSSRSSAAPPIEVRVRDGRLEVRDHGAGIEAQDLPHVFDRFYRAASARAMPGSGLGLAIVRQFAETHGGAVRAENAHGGGARLTLQLPALPIDPADADEAPIDDARPSSAAVDEMPSSSRAVSGDARSPSSSDPLRRISGSAG